MHTHANSRESENRIRVDFDPETLTTTATVPTFAIEVSTPALGTLLDAGDPRNWSKYVNRFFRRSEPGQLVGQCWNPEASPGAWNANRGGQIYEIAAWQWNAVSSAEIHNILQISDFERTSCGISYRYALRKCLKSNFGLGWTEGGLDRNEGYYSVAAQRITPRGTWRALVSAEKRVHYAIPYGDPFGVVNLLNLMAPALVGFLMRELVYETARIIATGGVDRQRAAV
jgi:hypothetical protein